MPNAWCSHSPVISCWSHRLLDGMFTRQSDGLEPTNDDFQEKFKILEIQFQMVTLPCCRFKGKGWICATLLVSRFMIHNEILGLVSCPVTPGRDLFSFLEDEHPTNASNSPQSLKPLVTSFLTVHSGYMSMTPYFSSCDVSVFGRS